MRLPIQAKPVKRPELIQPHTTVDVVHSVLPHGEDLTNIKNDLTHGANYNDPPALRMPTYVRMKQTCFTCPVPGWF